jgi:excisionase family DNA binding protein
MSSATVRSRPGYATTDQAAEYLGLSRQTLANWRSLGKGPRYAKRGRIVRYAWRDLDAWLNSPDSK